MDTNLLFFAGFTVSGMMLGYGLCLIRHRHAIDYWQFLEEMRPND